jgi:hypothetical protein
MVDQFGFLAQMTMQKMCGTLCRDLQAITVKSECHEKTTDFADFFLVTLRLCASFFQ